MDSPAIFVIVSEGICPTSAGERIFHISPIRALSTTWVHTLSTNVFSATWDINELDPRLGRQRE